MVGKIKKYYDTVIIGSGFGGSVLACRLAPYLKDSLCILERGKRYHMGEFPVDFFRPKEWWWKNEGMAGRVYSNIPALKNLLCIAVAA